PRRLPTRLRTRTGRRPRPRSLPRRRRPRRPPPRRPPPRMRRSRPRSRPKPSPPPRPKRSPPRRRPRPSLPPRRSRLPRRRPRRSDRAPPRASSGRSQSEVAAHREIHDVADLALAVLAKQHRRHAPPARIDRAVENAVLFQDIVEAGLDRQAEHVLVLEVHRPGIGEVIVHPELGIPVVRKEIGAAEIGAPGPVAARNVVPELDADVARLGAIELADQP